MPSPSSASRRFDVAVVGSGFAGAILARLLAAAGRSVLVVERGRHPRFALGESSTPLAAIALERLARRPELAAGGPGGGDLHALAAAGRWRRDLDPPTGEGVVGAGGRRHLRRGLKRGFTFYRHRPGRPFAEPIPGGVRMLVAASPEDALADNHWLRADVDHHLARRAAAAGVVLWEGCELDGIRVPEDGGPVLLAGRMLERQAPVPAPDATPGGPGGAGSLSASVATAGRSPAPDVAVPGGPGGAGPRFAPAAAGPPAPGERFTVEAGFVVDASGPGGFLARHLPLAAADPGTPDTALLYGHFEGVRRFADALDGPLEPGPYPDDRAAVHHFLDEGWMYVLRFDPEDDDRRALTSAGFVLRREAADALADRPPEAAFRAMLDRYPSLAATFRDARPVRPVGRVERLPHRLARAAGRRWLLLPHTHAFFDPLFSTGMAWSLVGVERAADLLLATEPGAAPAAHRLAAYESLLAAEADHVADLVAGAWLAMGDFRLAAAHAQLYFVAASFQEAKQRLTAGDHLWDGFLGATDALLRPLFREARRRLEAAPSPGGFEAWVAEAAAPRNLAGLADPVRRNLYPVDLDVLVERGHLLGLSRDEVRAALPRLRSLD